MTNKSYIPKCGDIVWIDLNPQAGKEHAKRRPVVVLSPVNYNKKVGLILGCPITSKIKDYPFEVILPADLKTKGAVLSDQVKSLDWKIRKAEFLETIDLDIIKQITRNINLLLAVD